MQYTSCFQNLDNRTGSSHNRWIFWLSRRVRDVRLKSRFFHALANADSCNNTVQEIIRQDNALPISGDLIFYVVL